MSPFEDLFEIPIRNGLTRPTSVRGSGVKMINMGELFAHSRIKNISMDRVPLSKEESDNYLLKNGDLLFARQSLVLSGAGKCSIFLGDAELVTYEGHIIRTRLDSKKAVPLFYYYYFNSPIGRKTIESIIEQVAAAGIRGSDLAKLRVHVPALTYQYHVAHILGSLDDKIEVNRTINKTLEAMARAIFQSWFVDFDPIRAKTEGRQPDGMDESTARMFPNEFEEIEGREVPKGWMIASLPEIFEINPQRSLSKDQIAPYLDMHNVPTRGHRPIGWVDRAFSSGTKFVNGDTLMARITPCLENGKTIFVDFLNEAQVGWGSTEYIVLRPKPPLPPEFGYLLARDEEFRAHAILNMSGSSGRQRVPSKCFDSYQIVVPTKPVAEKFGEIVKLLIVRIKKNDEQSRTLVALRDSLLPKLMSGEITV
jgi:type I restriction enzyme S subunit